MAGELQKAPLGVLGALALKVMGRNPDTFSDTVVPTIDVYDQYLARELIEVRSTPTIAIAARTAAAAHVPPQGFAWRVLAIGVNFDLNVADIAITATAITSVTSPAGNGVAIEPQGSLVVNGSAGLSRFLGFYLPRPFLLPPGLQVNQRVYLSANVTVAIAVNFSMLVQPIEL